MNLALILAYVITYLRKGLTLYLYSAMNVNRLHQVSKRYQYGELRLSLLYRYSSSVFSVRNLMDGIYAELNLVQGFLQTNFAWLLAVFVYVTIILSPILATGRSQGDTLQEATYAFTITSIAAVVATIGLFLLRPYSFFCAI